MLFWLRNHTKAYKKEIQRCWNGPGMDHIRQKPKSEKFWGEGGGLQCPKIPQLFGEFASVIRLDLGNLRLWTSPYFHHWILVYSGYILLKVNYGNGSFISRMLGKISLVTARMLESLDNS